MNLLTCNLRPSFASGLSAKDVSQKMQFHHAAAPSLEGFIQKNSPPSQNPIRHFENPNFFNKNNLDKNIPSSYKSSTPPKVHIEEENLDNYSVMIPEKAKHKDTDNILIEEAAMDIACENESPSSTDNSFEMEVSENNSESEMSDSDDDFIVFETEEGPCEEENSQEDLPVNSTYDCDLSSDDDEEDESGDENWENKTMVFYNSEQRKGRQVSICESEDSFIVFGDEDTEERPEKNKKSKVTKKVTFAEEPELSTVHMMIKWSFAYRKARKGIWEQYARDNERFRFRVSRCADTLNKCLQPKHRQKIYEERFKERPE